MLVHSNGEVMKTLASLSESEKVKPYVSKSLPFEEMTNAHRSVESGKSVGKVIVTI